MNKINKLVVALSFLMTAALGIPSKQEPILTKYQNHYSYNYSTSAKQEWKCVNNVCEEVVIRCKNGVCETKKKNQIDAKVFKPEVLHLDPPPFDVKNFHSSIQQSWRCVDNSCQETVTMCNNGVCTKKITPFSGEAFKPEIPNVVPSTGEAVIDYKNYIWSNSEQISKKCQDSICTTVTKTCTNGECQEKTVTDKL